jgi:Predicted membrane protein (DUF2142)
MPTASTGTTSDDSRHSRRVRSVKTLVVSPFRVFLVAFVLLLANGILWSLASPLFSSPDEPAHVEHAVAVVRGQFIGSTVKDAGNANTVVRIPKVFAQGKSWSSCFNFNGLIPASCALPMTRSTKVGNYKTYVGRYPPLYYAFVGLPSLVAVSPTGIYLMRIMSDLLSAVILALSVMSVMTWSKNHFLLIGIFLAATPMAFFLSSSVNPSGFEIAAATCLWCSGLILVLEHADAPPKGLVALVTGATVTLLLARGLSPLWVLLIWVVLGLVAGWQAVRNLSRDGFIRWTPVVLVPFGIFAVIWIFTAHALDLLPLRNHLPKDDVVQLAGLIFGFTSEWIQQMVGVFGWLDTAAPLATYLFWYIGVGFLLILALASAGRRQIVALLLTIAIVLFLPVVISILQVHRLGVIWQARYIMPMAVGLPLLAAAFIDWSGALRSLRLRLAWVLCFMIALADFSAFTKLLRRYVEGVTGPFDYFDGPWHPPLGAVALTIAGLIVTVLLMTMVFFMIKSEPGRPRHAGYIFEDVPEKPAEASEAQDREDVPSLTS